MGSASYEIRLVVNDYVRERWSQVCGLLAEGLADSDFSPGFTAGRPAEHTQEEMQKPDGDRLRHVVALGPGGQLVGAVLCLRVHRPEGATEADGGWFVTSQTLPASERMKVADALVHRVHEEFTKAGYEIIVTEMGTQAGAAFLSRRHGYLPAPVEGRPNRWIRVLPTRAGSAIRDISEKSEWKGVRGQHARYATTDIEADEVIIDLKRLMERVRDPSVATMQLGEDYYYRSSEGRVSMNHHCRPNGYVRFDDLTYRALRDVKAGEELTFHYCTTEYELAEPFDCRCGAPDCLGRVRGFKYMSPQEVERIRDLISPFLASKLRTPS